MDVVARLKKWNRQNIPEDDFPFALALLLSLANPEEVSNHTVSTNVMDFILDLLHYRTNNNKNRVETALDSIREYSKRQTNFKN